MNNNPTTPPMAAAECPEHQQQPQTMAADGSSPKRIRLEAGLESGIPASISSTSTSQTSSTMSATTSSSVTMQPPAPAPPPRSTTPTLPFACDASVGYVPSSAISSVLNCMMPRRRLYSQHHYQQRCNDTPPTSTSSSSSSSSSSTSAMASQAVRINAYREPSDLHLLDWQENQISRSIIENTVNHVVETYASIFDLEDEHNIDVNEIILGYRDTEDPLEAEDNAAAAAAADDDVVVDAEESAIRMAIHEHGLLQQQQQQQQQPNGDGREGRAAIDTDDSDADDDIDLKRLLELCTVPMRDGGLLESDDDDDDDDDSDDSDVDENEEDYNERVQPQQQQQQHQQRVVDEEPPSVDDNDDQDVVMLLPPPDGHRMVVVDAEHIEIDAVGRISDSDTEHFDFMEAAVAVAIQKKGLVSSTSSSADASMADTSAVPMSPNR